MLNIQNLIDDANSYETVRELRWPEGIRCAHGDAEQVTKQGVGYDPVAAAEVPLSAVRTLF